ncbi:flagellar basal body P-ring formation chaperone FlgA [Marivita sp. S0852]|uniref:flagellar basal body P-ring formation chaperone FlgA n=1 Tax=Marivita sp. S0852 TaxID=3373893 RepID=UPI00398200FA
MAIIITCLPHGVFAETVFARATLRAKEIVTMDMLETQDVIVAGAAQNIKAVIGKEVKRAVYAGRPVLLSNLSPPALVERNQIVQATFSVGGLTITTEARALERGAMGDVIVALNLVSRAKITAEVQADGNLKALP